MTTIYVSDKTALPERRANDLYRTERTLIQAALDHFIQPGRHISILDPGAGDGRWGQMASAHMSRYRCCNENTSWVTGVEFEDQPKPEGFNDWFANQDYLTWQAMTKADLVVCNPPYFLAEEFIRRSWDLLKPGGEMIFLLRLAFMESVERYNGLWNEIWPEEVAVLSRRPSFYGGKTNGTAFGLFYFNKSVNGDPTGLPRRWRTSLLLHERDKNHEK